MIKVNRANVSVPASLHGPTSPAALERQANERARNSAPPRKMCFRVYKKADVVEALELLFHKKCAYCEGDYAATGPVDIEHFRPKSKVRHARGADMLDGYWWLAAEWENLLPSCPDCNRARYHQRIQGGVGRRTLRGKENYFPLATPVCAAHVPGCETAERPLLLDPTRHDPAAYFDWTDQGGVVPRNDNAGLALPEATTSIEGYGLDRFDLFTSRQERAIETLSCIVRLKENEDSVRRYPNDPRFVAAVQREMDLLKRYADKTSRYSGMARHLIARHYSPVP